MEVQAETRDIKPRTIKSHKQHIKRVLREQTDIFDPIETTKAILKMKGLKEQKLCKSYIDRILISYSLFCEANLIPYDKPKLKYETPIPIIPKTQQVQAIINNARPDNAAIFLRYYAKQQ